MFKLVVLFSLLALSAAKPGFVAPIAYGAVPAVTSVSQYDSSLVHGSPLYTSNVYSSPYVVPAVVPAVSQAKNSPAIVIDAVNGVPLDTPEVVAARVAHYQAKALSRVHHLRKRSVAPVTYSAIVSPVTHGAVVSPLSPLPYSAPYVTGYSSSSLVSLPLAYSTVYPKSYGVHSW